MSKTIFGIDIKEFKKIGKGKEGVVYLGPDNMLLKVYRSARRCASEYKIFKEMENIHYFPKVHNCKGSYMLREYVQGTLLVEYIRENGLSKILANNLIDLSEFFYNTKYLKIDGIDKHVFVLEDESLMVIDPRRKKYKFHRSLLKILKSLNQEYTFLNQLIKNRPELVLPLYEKENIDFDKYKESTYEELEEKIEKENKIGPSFLKKLSNKFNKKF